MVCFSFFYIPKYNEQRIDTHSSSKISFPLDTELSENEKCILSNLKIWRHEKSKEDKIPIYMVSKNVELVSITKVKPQSINELLNIKGFAEPKTSKYGNDMIAIINATIK